MTVLIDLLWYAAVFICAWLIYLALHWGGARLHVFCGIGLHMVALSLFAAIGAGAISWFAWAPHFSSPEVHAFASITAPLCFIGFYGVWALLGPVTVDRSITLTIVRALQSASGGRLSERELQAAVPFERLFAKRLRELTGSGVLDKAQGQFHVTARGLRAYKFYVWLGRQFRVDFQ